MSNPLVDPDSVRAVSGTALDNATLDQIIADAHVLLEGIYASAEPPVTTAQWEAVERYLAAYMAWLRDPTMRVTSDRTGASSVSMAQADFLEQAIALDPTGILQQRFDKKTFKPYFRAAQTTRGGYNKPLFPWPYSR